MKSFIITTFIIVGFSVTNYSQTTNTTTKRSSLTLKKAVVIPNESAKNVIQIEDNSLKTTKKQQVVREEKITTPKNNSLKENK